MVKFCVPINIKYVCRFSFLAHCVCNRCVGKSMDPPGPILSKNWGVRTPSTPLWMRLWENWRLCVIMTALTTY